MLIRMTLQNFRSYKDENTLLLASTSKIRNFEEHVKEVGQLKLLKFIGIYGDNASGKTNILKAANFIKMLVGYNQVTDLDFAFKENEAEPTLIEMVFCLDGLIYQYGIKVHKQTVPFVSLNILDEYLNIIGNGEARSKEIYSAKNGINPNLIDKNDKAAFDLFLQGYKQLTKTAKNRLFLNYINDQDKIVKKSDLSGHFQKVFAYFKNDLVVLGAESTNMAYSQQNYLSTIIPYVKAFDHGIEDIKLFRIPNEDITKIVPQQFFQDIINQLYKLNDETITLTIGNDNYFFFSKDPDSVVKCETLQLKHHYINSWFKFSEESEGTKKFIILMSFFSNKNAKKTFFLDELERSMHPASSEYILRFFDHETHAQETQFIFTTHNPSFMKTNLRRDEIYFAEKDMYGTSAIFPLTDFETRSNSNLPALFLEGKFRKIPESGRNLFDL